MIAAQNNVIKTNYIETKIENTQENGECRLCGDKDKTINHKSECSKQVEEEYKNRYNCMAKMIH